MTDHICPEPGCGMLEERVLVERLTTSHDEHYIYECPRNADAHALCARVAKLEAAKAEAAVLSRYQLSLSDAIAERDTALAQLRAREAEVLALREWITTTAQHPAFCRANFNGEACTCGKSSVLSSTSATAQEITQKIERRALQMGWERFSALEREQKESGIRYTYKQALAQARAAFLGTNNP